MVRRVFDHTDFPSTWAPRFLGDKNAMPATPIRRADEAAVMPVAL